MNNVPEREKDLVWRVGQGNGWFITGALRRGIRALHSGYLDVLDRLQRSDAALDIAEINLESSERIRREQEDAVKALRESRLAAEKTASEATATIRQLKSENEGLNKWNDELRAAIATVESRHRSDNEASQRRIRELEKLRDDALAIAARHRDTADGLTKQLKAAIASLDATRDENHKFLDRLDKQDSLLLFIDHNSKSLRERIDAFKKSSS